MLPLTASTPMKIVMIMWKPRPILPLTVSTPMMRMVMMMWSGILGSIPCSWIDSYDDMRIFMILMIWLQYRCNGNSQWVNLGIAHLRIGQCYSWQTNDDGDDDMRATMIQLWELLITMKIFKIFLSSSTDNKRPLSWKLLPLHLLAVVLCHWQHP